MNVQGSFALDNVIKGPVATGVGLALGTATYGATVGPQFPNSTEEWVGFGLSLLIYAFGLLFGPKK